MKLGPKIERFFDIIWGLLINSDCRIVSGDVLKGHHLIRFDNIESIKGPHSMSKPLLISMLIHMKWGPKIERSFNI